jgi:formylglycine-generating enzyme required for sulfatase activity
MKKITCTIIALICMLWSLPAFAAERGVAIKGKSAAKERKIALVIGNSAYTVSPLKNPANDARLMADTLRSLGFIVDERTNLGQGEMKTAIEAFGRSIKKGGVGLFYYAGHGMQVNGRNYLIPVDTDIQGEAEVDIKAVDAGAVLAKMDMAQNVMNIVILDACRNNPFTRSFRSSGAGLATMDAPSGTIIAYATSPGKVASDGTGANGLYTQEVVKAVKKPGLKIEDAFKQVRSSVQSMTKGRQVPWESSSLVGDFYFAGSAGGVDTSKLDSLAEGSKERKAELARLMKLEADAAKQRQKEQAEIARKEEELAALDSQIVAMKSKLGTTEAGPNDNLEKMLAMVENKEADALKIEKLKQQHEAKEVRRQVEIQQLKKEARVKSIPAIENDIANFEKIANSPYGKDMVSAAWKSLTTKYTYVEGIAGIREGSVWQLRRLLVDGIAPNWNDPETGMEFVFVKGGCFQMGDTFGDGDIDEKPVHEVCVNDFYIGKYEVTQAQWRKYMRYNPSVFQNCGDNCPVEGVSWNGTQDYIGILNQRTDKNYRLPTEAEWEYAARSGGKSEKYSGGNDVNSVAWYDGNSDGKTHVVGHKQPNGLGIYDMSGNVSEWCQDWYDGNYYSSSPKDNPQGPSRSINRVIRGGSWNKSARLTLATYRIWSYPGYTNGGFRLVKTP